MVRKTATRKTAQLSTWLTLLVAAPATAAAAAAPAAPPQNYGVTSHLNGALCWDVTAASRDDGTPVQLAPCKDSASQTWALSGQAIRVYGNMCLDVTDGVDRDGTQLQVWGCKAPNVNQRFERVGNQVRWVGSNRCLDVANGRGKSGTRLQLWTCSQGESRNQAFDFVAHTVASLGQDGVSKDSGAVAPTLPPKARPPTGTPRRRPLSAPAAPTSWTPPADEAAAEPAVRGAMVGEAGNDSGLASEYPAATSSSLTEIQTGKSNGAGNRTEMQTGSGDNARTRTQTQTGAGNKARPGSEDGAGAGSETAFGAVPELGVSVGHASSTEASAPRPAPDAPPKAASRKLQSAGRFCGFNYISLAAFLNRHPVLKPLHQDIIAAAASVHPALPPTLLAAVAMEESSGNPAVAGGLMQFTWAPTWAAYGQGDINNGRDSLFAAARYLEDLLREYDNDLAAALRAYNGDANGNYVAEIRSWLGGGYPYGPGT